MRKPQTKTAERTAEDGSQNITLRVQLKKLRELDKIADRIGITRSAVIQIAISEKIARETSKP